MTSFEVMRRIGGLKDQPDVRDHPVRAVYRRLRWRSHWRFAAGGSFHIQHWTRGMSIDLPRSGSAAQVYYREFSSPFLAEAMTEALSPGMSMIDIGAHVGEYSLLGAALVGEGGHVSAIEPQVHLAELIRHNASLNNLANVSVEAVAVTDHEGTSGFEIDITNGAGWVCDEKGSRTPCTTLDELVTKGGGRVDFLKLDAAGSELAVLAGGQRSVTGGALPRIVYKLYHPKVAGERFGCDSLSILEQLADLGYEQRLLTGSMEPVANGGDAMAALGANWYGVPVLAIRRSHSVNE
jgi:FkbM family methyltransferase